MTATRWWVKIGARWIARVNSVQPHLNLLFTAMTGIGVASGALKYYGLQQYTPFFIALTGLATIAYAYLYSEGGVWNQTSRDKTDMSTNYSGPTMLMDAKIEARQLAYLGYVLQNGQEKELDALIEDMDELTYEEWAALRDGVDIEEIEREEQ